MKKSALLLIAFVCLQATGMAINIDEMMGYTSALLETNGFPGAYSDHNVLTHGIASGQTVVNIKEGDIHIIGPAVFISNTWMIILYNTITENPTQAEVDKTGESLLLIAKQVKEHFNQLDLSITVRVNPDNLGPFGNKKAHFDGSDGQMVSPWRIPEEGPDNKSYVNPTIAYVGPTSAYADQGQGAKVGMKGANLLGK
jgi:hypothetical protein